MNITQFSDSPWLKYIFYMNYCVQWVFCYLQMTYLLLIILQMLHMSYTHQVKPYFHELNSVQAVDILCQHITLKEAMTGGMEQSIPINFC